jgi:hypothetical protein
MDISELPEEVRERLPNGYMPEHNIWLVLPLDNGTETSIVSVNSWLRKEEPYPTAFGPVIWFGVDAIGNFLGWDTQQLTAILWNPYDNEPHWRGSVSDLWRFILNGYSNAA